MMVAFCLEKQTTAEMPSSGLKSVYIYMYTVYCISKWPGFEDGIEQHVQQTESVVALQWMQGRDSGV